MGKKRIVLIVLAVLLVLGLAVVGAVSHLLSLAANQQQTAYQTYQQMMQHAQYSTVDVTENEIPIGTYSLEQLGILDATVQEIRAQFDLASQMTQEEFAQLPILTRLQWGRQERQPVQPVFAQMQSFDAACVLEDLRNVQRTEAENAYVCMQDGTYQIYSEVEGTMLQEEQIVQALQNHVAQLGIDGQTESAAPFELTSCACYLEPEVTLENTEFDLEAIFDETISDMVITVSFERGKQAISYEKIKTLVRVDARGKLQINWGALNATIARWSEQYNRRNVTYLFDSYVSGPVPISFLRCDRVIDEPALRAMLQEQLLSLESGTINAPTKQVDQDGELFSLGDTPDTYIEVDITNQHLAYYKNGNLIIATDVVTGYPIGRATPTGLYYTHNMLEEQRLVGDDYDVFVYYWIRFVGNYGMHDATWRDEFGSDLYLYEGSHGCVNIPLEAMATIYDNVVDGTPILLFKSEQ